MWSRYRKVTWSKGIGCKGLGLTYSFYFSIHWDFPWYGKLLLPKQYGSLGVSSNVPERGMMVWEVYGCHHTVFGIGELIEEVRPMLPPLNWGLVTIQLFVLARCSSDPKVQD